MVTPSDRYKQDESGQWWYRMGPSGIRTRAQVKVCGHCGEDYVNFMPRSKFCCRRCAGMQMSNLRTYPNGPDDIHWRGGRKRDHGYVRLWKPDHPRCDSKGYFMEHRLVMEQKLGRLLERHEQVHHLNGIRDDNRVENLELWSKSHPSGVRVHDKHCPTCTCGATASGS